MPNYYENFLVYKGGYYAIYFHAETETSSSVHKYFESCDDVIQASLLFLVKTIADTGRIYDETKFRDNNYIGLYEEKAKTRSQRTKESNTNSSRIS